MQKAYQFLFFLFFLIFTTHAFAVNTPSRSHNTIQWQAYSQDSFYKAKKEHRLILLFGFTDWCPWCKKMRATTLQDSTVIKLINDHFVPIALNLDTDNDIASQYNMVGLPTTVILDSNNHIVQTYAGYITPEEFAKNLAQTVRQYNK